MVNDNNKGFTLIELIVVIGIIAVVVGIGGLSISTLFNTKLNSYANDIGTLITETRYKHMAQVDNYYLQIRYNSSSEDYNVEMCREYIEGEETITDVVKSVKVDKGYRLIYKQHSVTDEIDIKDLSEGKLIISFKGNGAIQQNGGIIYITKSNVAKTKQIDINILTGKVVVSDRK